MVTAPPATRRRVDLLTLGNGSNGCLKGWFVRFISQGPVSQYDPNTDKGASLGVQLVR